MKKHLFLLLFWTAIVYLVFAFIMWQFNPGLWPIGTRMFAVYLGIAFGFILTFFTHE